MWHTSHGDRVLTGMEAAVFRESVGYMRDMITSAVEINEPHDTGIGVFDSLQPTQQLAVLHTVAIALLDKQTDAPELCATLEGTVYAVYHELLSLIEIEIDGNRGANQRTELRSAILDARLTPISQEGENWSEFDSGPSDIPTIEPICESMDRWLDEINLLADRVLWDRDFELEELFADKDPGQTAAIKTYFGISDDYFSTPAPDPMSDEFQRIDRELVALRSSSPPIFKNR